MRTKINQQNAQINSGLICAFFGFIFVLIVNTLFEGLTKKTRLFHTWLHKRNASQIEQTPDEVQQKDGKRIHELAKCEIDRHYVIIN